MVKQLIIATTLPLVFSCSSSIASSDVAAAERARADAIAGHDTTAYSRLIAPDLLMTDRTGGLVTKGDRIAAVDSGREQDTRRAEDQIEVRTYGNIALVIGRATSQEEGRQHHDYFTRIWAQRAGRLEMVGAHYTDITATLNDNNPESPSEPTRPVPALPVATTGHVPLAEEEVQRAVREQHQAYWRKDPQQYELYAGTDVLRIAENGIRTREELIQGMRGNARLPAPPSEQFDVRVHLYGNAAVTTWLDQGAGPRGPILSRYTVVFVRRDDRWQMVHIQSTGVKAD